VVEVVHFQHPVGIVIPSLQTSLVPYEIPGLNRRIDLRIHTILHLMRRAPEAECGLRDHLRACRCFSSSDPEYQHGLSPFPKGASGTYPGSLTEKLGALDENTQRLNLDRAAHGDSAGRSGCKNPPGVGASFALQKRHVEEAERSSVLAAGYRGSVERPPPPDPNSTLLRKLARENAELRELLTEVAQELEGLASEYPEHAERFLARVQRLRQRLHEAGS